MSLARQEAAFRTLETELDAAVLDGARWKRVCDALAATLGGTGTALIPIDPSQRGLGMVHSDSIGGGVRSYIRDGWYRNDVRQAAWPVMRRRGFAVDHDIVDEDVIRKHPYYADFLAGDGVSTFIGIHVPTTSGEWTASVQRAIAAGPADRKLLESVPHIRARLVGAARAALAIGAASLENWRSYFDGPDRGFALLDREGLVTETNSAAETLLAPFLRARGDLALLDSRAGTRLAELMARACAERPRIPLPPPVQLPLAAGQSLSLDVVPLPSALRHFYLKAVAMMVIRLAETPMIDKIGRLVGAFRLTAAEARLAQRIGAGEPLRDAADAEGVTYETARTRLKSIFEKTGTTRQAQLAVLVTKVSEPAA
jgi:DNA-binding CsgD family transcriptional regulator